MHLISDRSSDCVKRMFVSLMDAEVTVTFKNGSIYYYENVSRLAIANLMMNKNMSLGFWVNKNLVNKKDVPCYRLAI